MYFLAVIIAFVAAVARSNLVLVRELSAEHSKETKPESGPKVRKLKPQRIVILKFGTPIELEDSRFGKVWSMPLILSEPISDAGVFLYLENMRNA